MRLPPTPCRVCFRPCVFNKFSHFWQKRQHAIMQRLNTQECQTCLGAGRVFHSDHSDRERSVTEHTELRGVTVRVEREERPLSSV